MFQGSKYRVNNNTNKFFDKFYQRKFFLRKSWAPSISIPTANDVSPVEATKDGAPHFGEKFLAKFSANKFQMEILIRVHHKQAEAV